MVASSWKSTVKPGKYREKKKQVASMSMKREVKLTKKRDERGDTTELYQIMKRIEDEKGK